MEHRTPIINNQIITTPTAESKKIRIVLFRRTPGANQQTITETQKGNANVKIINLSEKVLSDAKIKCLENGLKFTLPQAIVKTKKCKKI